MKENKKFILKMVYSAVFLALAFVLPMITGSLQQIGNMLCPMHLPVLLCGYICGWPWGLAVGFIAPLLRSFVLSMPPLMPTAISMAFELAVYGFVVGLMHSKLPKKFGNLYLSLITAMLSGRLVWGFMRLALAGFSPQKFPFSAFVSGAVLTAIPGIIIQIVFIPLIVTALKKTKLMLN